MQKLLTIVIPTYNMQNYLHRCLDSLVLKDADLMSQLEVLVVKYSVHLGTQYFLTTVCPVKGTETGLTGGRKKTKYKMEVLSKCNAKKQERICSFPGK